MDGMTTYYNHFPIPHMYSFPLMLPEWSPTVSPCNIYTPPLLPVTVVNPHIITPILCPYTSTLVTEPIIPIIPTVAVDVTPVVCNNNLYSQVYTPEFNCTEKSVPTEALSDKVQYLEDVLSKKEIEEVIDKSEDSEQNISPIERYLQLPRELFPTARMLSIDPNSIIDEFCKLASIRENVSWILDLEFGIPRAPVTRAIAAYDVKFNSVHCKNTPGAIHPGFEKCNSGFKRAIIFYYDCIVSNWYNGYIVLNYDKCVEKFQSWLQVPMQIFGMCWP
ncbi:uncharacterized protein LOC123870305 [Maniola jurtina]|uniref:uncharacterized protein LOC123870305 n=1 Tax=Maniola jurtina TaxID=191418 RepID=UPI001E688670|nr:uncharacterized protein LOC123870305 [Maniola jurtina]